jgi:hypothetical protein
MPKGRYPVKVGPGDTRYVGAKYGPDGQVKILLPKRPKIASPGVTTSAYLPNPSILDKVTPAARQIVMDAAQIGDPIPYAFGRQGMRPSIIGGDDSDENLILDMMWSVGEIEAINGVSGIGSKVLYMPDIGYVDISGAEHEHFYGTSGQSASTILTALKGSYDALPNIAHSVITMQLGWNLNCMAFIDGVHVADPRTSPHTIAWSENAALILADILDRCGYTLDWASVGAAADWCDDPIDTAYSPLGMRCPIGGQIRERNELAYWVHTLAQHAGVYLDVRGGNAIFVPDKPRSSTHTVTSASMVENTERLRRRPAGGTPELVTINYLSPTGLQWSAQYGTSGGSGTETTLSMPFWDNRYAAGRKAIEVYNKSQHEIESLEFIGWDDGLEHTLGDVGTVTHAGLGLSAVEMALIENEPVDRGRWRRKYAPHDDADYPDSTTGVTAGEGGESLSNPYYPPDGPTPTLTAELVTSTSPNYYRIKIEFAPVTWAYLQDYKVVVYIEGASPQAILMTEYVPKGSQTGSPLTITLYADMTDSPGFQMAIGNSPLTVYRVDVYCRSLWIDQEGYEILSAIPGTATVTDPEILPVTLGAWWAMEEASGTRYNSHQTISPAPYHLTDASSLGNTTGIKSNAVDFGATSPVGGYLYTDHSADSPLPELMSSTAVCGALWVKFNEIVYGETVFQYIIHRAAPDFVPGASPTEGTEWAVFLAWSGTQTSPWSMILKLSVNGLGLSRIVSEIDTIPEAGQWYFVYFYHDPEEGKSGISVNDGTLFKTPYDVDVIRARNGAITLGMMSANTPAENHYLNGQLDEVALFYGGPLSTEMVTFLYNSGSGRTYAEWVAAYPNN